MQALDIVRPGEARRWLAPSLVIAGVLAALAAVAAVPGWRCTHARAGRASPPLSPADRDLAWASPALLAGNPRRRFYAGRDPAEAVTIEDLRAMAHRRLPGFVLEYLEGGGEDEATVARNVAALAQ